MPPPPRGPSPALRTLPSKQREDPVASTSRVPIPEKRQGRSRTRSRTSDSPCWCTVSSDKRAPTVASFALAVLLAPLARASPVSPLSPRQTEKQRAVIPPSLSLPTPPPRPPRHSETDSSPEDGLDRPTPSALIAQRRPAAGLRKRVLDKWVLENGEWVLEPVVTLRGRVVGTPTSAIDALAPIEDNDDSHSSIRVSALQDNLDALPTSSSSFSTPPTRTSLSITPSSSLPLASSSSTAVPPHGTPKIAAAASPSDFTIPSGWASTPRETNFYAVPVIVSMSVLLSIAVVGTVLLSVVWRRKARVKRNAAGEAEKGRMGRIMEKVGLATSEKKATRKSKGRKGGKKGGGGDTGGSAEGAAVAGLARTDSRASSDAGSGSGTGRRAITRANSSAIPAAGRLRPRRRRHHALQSNQDDSEEDEARTALTGSQAAAIPDTLTARLQARLRRSGATSPTPGGPSTVFSRDLDRTSTRSTYSSNGHLSRTSRTASIVDDTASRLGQPIDRDDPLALSRSSSRRSLTLSVPVGSSPSAPADSPTSGFGSTFLDVPLPALGPPAYRPASSTVQSTTRHSIARVPVPRVEIQHPEEVVVESRSNPSAPQEEQWHWPNEKPAAAAAAVPSTSRPAPRRRVPPPVTSPGQPDEEPPAEPSLYSAHLATDDKAVLARLREQASSPARRSHLASTSQLPEASAPMEEEADVDEEGFERLPVAGPSRQRPLSPSAPFSSSILPAPPRPVDFAFDYTSSSSPSSALDSDRKTSAGPSGASRRRAPIEDEHEETSFLPVYHARERILQMASAPPPDDDEELEQAETGSTDGAVWGELADEQDRARWEDREEQAEV